MPCVACRRVASAGADTYFLTLADYGDQMKLWLGLEVKEYVAFIDFIRGDIQCQCLTARRWMSFFCAIANFFNTNVILTK